MKVSKVYKTTIYALLLALIATTISWAQEPKHSHQNVKSKGVIKVMKTVPLGRFMIKVPTEMTSVARNSSIRSAEISENIWPDNINREKSRGDAFNLYLESINRQPPPKGKRSRIIKTIDFTGINYWSKGILYYSDYLGDQVKLDVLLDTGKAGIWVKMRSGKNGAENIDKIYSSMKNIANAYIPIPHSTVGPVSQPEVFFLEYGEIHLPYKIRESTYARFEGHPLSLKLEIEMTETHIDEPKDEGLLARTAAVIATGYATGVNIDRLRSCKRKVAGLDGEEEVDRMTDSHRTAVSFGWRYAGKKDSGEYPEIVIRMESPDGKLEEKLKIWDAILDSMRPLYKNLPRIPVSPLKP